MLSSPIQKPVVVLIGPTAIGKTALSLEIADRIQAEIISMDSMQVYRYMDIGTAKASEEERRRVKHHLIDIVNPDEQYNAACFVSDAKNAINQIHSQGKIPFITGGTGLYLSSLLNGLFDTIKVSSKIRDSLLHRLADQDGRDALYAELCAVDPISSERIHKNDTQRLIRALEIYHATGIPWSLHLYRQQQTTKPCSFTRLLILGLTCDRELLYKRIHERSVAMMGEAFLEEVSQLLRQGYEAHLPSMQSIGYRHMVGFIDGTYDRETATSTLIRDTRRYAKRQLTWFRRQQQVEWYSSEKTDEIFSVIDAFLQ